MPAIPVPSGHSTHGRRCLQDPNQDNVAVLAFVFGGGSVIREFSPLRFRAADVGDQGCNV